MQVQVIVNDPGKAGRTGRREGVGVGRGKWGVEQRGGADGEGETGMGKRGGEEVLARVGSGEGETWRVRLGGGNGGRGRGAMGRGRWGGGNRRGRRGSGQRGRGEKGAQEGISQRDKMKRLDGMRLQSFLTLFTIATPGTPANNNAWVE